MSEWENGYKVGYEAGYEAAKAEKSLKDKSTQIHDPGDIDKLYEEAFGAALFRQMKKDHEKF